MKFLSCFVLFSVSFLETIFEIEVFLQATIKNRFNNLYPISDVPEFRSDYTYVEDVNGWVKLHETPATWEDARLSCDHEGAVLASPLNNELQTATTNLMVTQNVNSVFTGIHTFSSMGNFFYFFFFSIEGVPLSDISSDWQYSGSDTKKINDDCVIMYSNNKIDYYDSYKTHPYICYKKQTDHMPRTTSNCGPIDSGYHQEHTTGSCYKFHHQAKTWSRASKKCTFEGGHLAVINSRAEAELLQKLILDNSYNTEKTAANQSFIGAQDWGNRGIWLTIHGKPLIDAGFDTWALGDPNDESDESAEIKPRPGNCVTLLAGEKFGLNNVWCGDLLTFICEKAPLDEIIWEV